MLHAILARKLDESIAEPQRLEDALTSTAIGTLVMVGARSLLAEWLSDAESADGSQIGSLPEDGPFNYGFWPRLAYAEPDVLIRLGDRLFVIEAKLSSGLHGKQVALGDESDESVPDQLERQWRSVNPDSTVWMAYPADMRQAIQKCKITMILLVDARRIRRAQREFSQSVSLLGNTVDLRILTWQKLFHKLSGNETTQQLAGWRRDLCNYLLLCDLESFAGLRTAIARPRAFTESMRQLSNLGFARQHIGLLATVESIVGEGALTISKLLAHLTSSRHSTSNIGLHNSNCESISFGIARLVSCTRRLKFDT